EALADKGLAGVATTTFEQPEVQLIIGLGSIDDVDGRGGMSARGGQKLWIRTGDHDGRWWTQEVAERSCDGGAGSRLTVEQHEEWGRALLCGGAECLVASEEPHTEHDLDGNTRGRWRGAVVE